MPTLRAWTEVRSLDVDVAATLKQALAAEKVRKAGATSCERVDVQTAARTGFDAQRLIEDEAAFGARREGGCGFCTGDRVGVSGAPSRARGQRQWRDETKVRVGGVRQRLSARGTVGDNTTQTPMTSSIPVQGAATTTAKKLAKSAMVRAAPESSVALTKTTVAPARSQQAAVEKASHARRTASPAPSSASSDATIAPEAPAAAVSQRNDSRAVLDAIDDLGHQIEISLRGLAKDTAEACKASILQLSKAPVVARAQLAHAHVTDRTIDSLRVDANVDGSTCGGGANV